MQAKAKTNTNKNKNKYKQKQNKYKKIKMHSQQGRRVQALSNFTTQFNFSQFK